MSQRVGVSLPVQEELTVSDHLRLARLAEERGFDSIFVGEIASTDAMAVVSLIASQTSTVRIGTGVVSIYTRSPVLTAMGVATAASIAPGRVFAGLGTGSHVVVEDWHGGELARPLERMREFVAAVRLALSGERVEVDGSCVRIRDFRLQVPTAGHVPLYVGAFNPAMLRTAGAIADGVILAFCPLEGLVQRVEHVREGAAAAGRDPAEVEIFAYVNAYAGDRVDEAMHRFRRLVLQYAVQPTHRAGFVEVFPRIDEATDLWRGGDRSGALTLVPDESVLRLCPVGDASDVVARLNAVRAAGVDVPVLFPQSLCPGDVQTPTLTIERVADALSAQPEIPRSTHERG